MSHSFVVVAQGLDEQDEERKMENLYTGQGVGADPEEEGDDDEDEVDGNVSQGWGLYMIGCDFGHHHRSPREGEIELTVHFFGLVGCVLARVTRTSLPARRLLFFLF